MRPLDKQNKTKQLLCLNTFGQHCLLKGLRGPEEKITIRLCLIQLIKHIRLWNPPLIECKLQHDELAVHGKHFDKCCCRK